MIVMLMPPLLEGPLIGGMIREKGEGNQLANRLIFVHSRCTDRQVGHSTGILLRFKLS
jgi:hypothetical protein